MDVRQILVHAIYSHVQETAGGLLGRYGATALKLVVEELKIGQGLLL